MSKHRSSRSVPSSSNNMSKICSIREIPFFAVKRESEKRGKEAEHYTLKQIATEVGMEESVILACKTNDEMATEL